LERPLIAETFYRDVTRRISPETTAYYSIVTTSSNSSSSGEVATAYCLAEGFYQRIT